MSWARAARIVPLMLLLCATTVLAAPPKPEDIHAIVWTSLNPGTMPYYSYEHGANISIFAWFLRKGAFTDVDTNVSEIIVYQNGGTFLGPVNMIRNGTAGKYFLNLSTNVNTPNGSFIIRVNASIETMSVWGDDYFRMFSHPPHTEYFNSVVWVTKDAGSALNQSVFEIGTNLSIYALFTDNGTTQDVNNNLSQMIVLASNGSTLYGPTNMAWNGTGRYVANISIPLTAARTTYIVLVNATMTQPAILGEVTNQYGNTWFAVFNATLVAGPVGTNGTNGLNATAGSQRSQANWQSMALWPFFMASAMFAFLFARSLW